MNPSDFWVRGDEGAQGQGEAVAGHPQGTRSPGTHLAPGWVIGPELGLTSQLDWGGAGGGGG